MAYGMRKLSNENLYKVFNKDTKQILMVCTTIDDAKKQILTLTKKNLKSENNVPIDLELYEKVKEDANNIYKKSSAYKSGWIVKTYKSLGGRYSGNKPEDKGLDRWYKEEWKDIGGKDYPVYRPIKRITDKTPLTLSEIDKDNLKKQIKLKQLYKGAKNLPPFKKKINIK